MDRQEIVSKLRELIKDGKLLSKAQNGGYYHGFDRKARKGELFRTRYSSIMAIDLETSLWINNLIKTDRIMESQVVSCVHLDLTNDYAIQKACMRGEMIKFDEFGKGCILYIE